MIKSLRIRAAIAILVVIVALIYLTPSLAPQLPEFWKKFLPTEKIPLGLDLQGGTHLLLEVDTHKALASTMHRTTENIKELLMEQRIRFRVLEEGERDLKVTFEFPTGAARDSFQKIIKDSFPDLEVVSLGTRDGKESAKVSFKEKRLEEMKKSVVEQSLETIRNRVDQFGVKEPEIIPEGENRIVVQLPGIKDTNRAKNLIGKTALLEFKLVDDEHSLEDALRGNVPEGSELSSEYRVDRETGKRTTVPILLKSKTLLTGSALESAKVVIGSRFGEPHVTLKFNAQGALDFERITGENVKRRLAIVLDGVVYSAPVIQEKISGGNAQITGAFTMDEAKDLAIVLRAGALPAPVTILEERTVGPSLGQDSIDKGIKAAIIGGVLVALFMAVYYKFSGIVANIALFLNMILILAFLAAFKATLTLPGIAGIVLIIGMSVDANVLIFERIREELRAGKTPRVAVDTGYSKAMLTILDTNVNTLIACLFLFGFGTGPVKGFATTLSVGIIASLFTAVFTTRIIFDYFIWQRKVSTISI